MKVVYSFNKRGAEAHVWTNEIAAASGDGIEFVPFNHDPFVPVAKYVRAQLLDNLYYEQHSGLQRLYGEIRQVMERAQADVLLVDNCPPYHPEFLRSLPVYKVLRVNDGPMAAYDRDFAYLHAYDHVLYHSPAYSRDLTMAEKLEYCGAKRFDLWPLAVFDSAFAPTLSEAELFARERDIDVVFIGSFARGKMAGLARIKKYFGRRCVMHGQTSFARNIYFNSLHGFPGWMTPVPFREFGNLYRRAKIGFNLHNRGKYTAGNYRMFDLPANGAMQVCDGGEFLSTFFIPGSEIVQADEIDDIIGKVDYFLTHPTERLDIAVAGYRAAMRRHRLKTRMLELRDLINAGMKASTSVVSPGLQRHA